jgi:hypothetical protein
MKAEPGAKNVFVKMGKGLYNGVILFDKEMV